jgi:hypothetical protein
MTELPAWDGEPTVAVMFIGNIGARRSTLIRQLGGNLHYGVGFMEGVAQQVSEQIVILDGKPLILMDVPVPYGMGEEAAIVHAERLTRALERGYKYKLFFVLRATNRGLCREDLAQMSAVNRCVRLANDTKVEFGIIINQIQDELVYTMYKENFTRESLRKLFRDPRFESYELDIEFNSVLLVRFNEEAVLPARLKEIIFEPVEDISGFANVTANVAKVVAIGVGIARVLGL